MRIDNFGRVIITEHEAFDSLYNGKLKELDNIFIEGDIDLFNKSVLQNADQVATLSKIEDLEILDKESFDQLNQKNWFMPEEYKSMDIESFLVSQCPSENYERLVKELDLFHQHNMIDLLRYIKYLVDTMRKNNIVWGVGRGSSVASYVLFLLGIHKIDSVKYNLDINEFLKETKNGI